MSCQHRRLGTRPNGPHTEQYCLDCGAHIKFVPVPKSSDDAARFVMPIGKHKGKALSDIPFSYLVWARENMSGSIQRAVRSYLAGFNQFEIDEAVAAE